MHDGHRQRMVARLEKGEESLQDHELLEILLFNAIPRKNTNELAHALLEKFGSLSALSRAGMESMASVTGIGKQTAAYLKCIFLTMRRMKAENEPSFPSARNFSEFSQLLCERMRSKTEECIELYATDKDGNILGMESYTSRERDRALLEPRVISKFFAENDPKALLIAHNHMEGSAAPSHSDDLFTRRMQAVCAFHGIPLYDHIIVSPTETFSYHACARLEYVASLPLEPLL